MGKPRPINLPSSGEAWESDSTVILSVYWLDDPYGSESKVRAFSDFLDLLDAIEEGARAPSWDSDWRKMCSPPKDVPGGEVTLRWRLSEQGAPGTAPDWVPNGLIPTLLDAYMQCRVMTVAESETDGAYTMKITWAYADHAWGTYKPPKRREP